MFFGDGALGQGLLYEVMNMASLWSLPVIYACENNLYGEYTKVEEMAAGELTGRAKAFELKHLNWMAKTYLQLIIFLKNWLRGLAMARDHFSFN